MKFLNRLFNQSDTEDNRVVITSTFVYHKGKPILYVIHHKDEDWQVLGDDELTESDALVVSADKIFKLDTSLKKLFTKIPPEHHAYRKSLSDTWIIEPYIVE